MGVTYLQRLALREAAPAARTTASSGLLAGWSATLLASLLPPAPAEAHLPFAEPDGTAPVSPAPPSVGISSPVPPLAEPTVRATHADLAPAAAGSTPQLSTALPSVTALPSAPLPHESPSGTELRTSPAKPAGSAPVAARPLPSASPLSPSGLPYLNWDEVQPPPGTSPSRQGEAPVQPEPQSRQVVRATPGSVSPLSPTADLSPLSDAKPDQAQPTRRESPAAARPGHLPSTAPAAPPAERTVRPSSSRLAGQPSPPPSAAVPGESAPPRPPAAPPSKRGVPARQPALAPTATPPLPALPSTPSRGSQPVKVSVGTVHITVRKPASPHLAQAQPTTVIVEAPRRDEFRDSTLSLGMGQF